MYALRKGNGTRTDSLGESNKDPAHLFFIGLRPGESGDTMPRVRDARASWLRLLSPHGSPCLIQLIWLADRGPLGITLHEVAHLLRGEHQIEKNLHMDKGIQTLYLPQSPPKNSGQSVVSIN